MSKEEMKDWLDRWNLIPSDGAKVLKIQKSKMSEYLSGDRKVPVYVAAHIETFDCLDKSKAKKLINKRLA
jgi:predicted transcriptional regulator